MNFNVTGIGEVLWDILPSGRQLGGAPANFSFHAKMLGADARLITRVGRDDLGRAIIQHCAEMGISTDAIQQDPQEPTGTATVELNHGGIPRFVITENAAWDNLAVTEEAHAAVREADAVCFGTLAQRNETSRAVIRSLVMSTKADALRIFDINLRQKYFSFETIRGSLELADVLKINDEELPVVADLFGLSRAPEDQLAELARRFDLTLVALTCGANGSIFYSHGKFSHEHGLRAQVVDTVGAGDAFTAMLTLGLLSGWEPGRINRCANEVAAYVVSQPGATPRLPGHMCLSESFSLKARGDSAINRT